MKKKADLTKVIFRITKDGEVYALLPRQAGNMHSHTCTFYTFSGHAVADLQHCTDRDKLATPEQYEDLRKDMVRLGYALDIRKRATYQDYKVRRSDCYSC